MTAEAVHAVTHQGALDLDDILSRRTRVSIETADRGRYGGGDHAARRPHARVVGGARRRGLERYVRLRDAEEAAEEAPDDAAAAAAYRALAPGP